jgi:anthranilate synthase component 2
MARPKILLVDNFDSFTYNVKDYLERAGAQVMVKARNQVRTEELSLYDGVVFSPGPGNPENIPVLQALVSEAIQTKPTFGICLGFQAIASHFGSLILPGVPVHGKIFPVSVVASGRLLEGIPTRFNVVRYHSLVVDRILSPLNLLLQTEEGIPMAFEHSLLPVAGVQFHPEAFLSENGLRLLENWLGFC